MNIWEYITWILSISNQIEHLNLFCRFRIILWRFCLHSKSTFGRWRWNVSISPNMEEKNRLHIYFGNNLLVVKVVKNISYKGRKSVFDCILVSSLNTGGNFIATHYRCWIFLNLSRKQRCYRKHSFTRIEHSANARFNCLLFTTDHETKDTIKNIFPYLSLHRTFRIAWLEHGKISKA